MITIIIRQRGFILISVLDFIIIFQMAAGYTPGPYRPRFDWIYEIVILFTPKNQTHMLEIRNIRVDINLCRDIIRIVMMIIKRENMIGSHMINTGKTDTINILELFEDSHRIF